MYITIGQHTFNIINNLSAVRNNNTKNKIAAITSKYILLFFMLFLTNTVSNLQFDPMSFIENLKHMGVGMLVIFVVIGIIILATKLVNYLFSE